MSVQELKLSVEKVDAVTVVKVTGAVDGSSVDLFKAELSPVCSLPGARVLLDCGQLTYLNSTSIGLLMKFQRGLVVSRGRLALCALNSTLVRTLELLQIGKSLHLFPTRAEALAALK